MHYRPLHYRPLPYRTLKHRRHVARKTNAKVRNVKHTPVQSRKVLDEQRSDLNGLFGQITRVIDVKHPLYPAMFKKHYYVSYGTLKHYFIDRPIVNDLDKLRAGWSSGSITNVYYYYSMELLIVTEAYLLMFNVHEKYAKYLLKLTMYLNAHYNQHTTYEIGHYNLFKMVIVDLLDYVTCKNGAWRKHVYGIHAWPDYMATKRSREVEQNFKNAFDML